MLELLLQSLNQPFIRTLLLFLLLLLRKEFLESVIVPLDGQFPVVGPGGEFGHVFPESLEYLLGIVPVSEELDDEINNLVAVGSLGFLHALEILDGFVLGEVSVDGVDGGEGHHLGQHYGQCVQVVFVLVVNIADVGLALDRGGDYGQVVLVGEPSQYSKLRYLPLHLRLLQLNEYVAGLQVAVVELSTRIFNSHDTVVELAGEVVDEPVVDTLLGFLVVQDETL